MSDKKKDAKSRIISFLTKADVTLTADEERILARWEHADHLMRCGTAYADMILKLTSKFETSKFTADNDISSAQEVFARSRQLNKTYLCHLHLEDIAQDLKRIRALIFPTATKPGEEKTFIDPKDVMALSKLHDSYTKQLSIIPQQANKPDLKKPVIIWELVGVEQKKIAMSVSTALHLADKMLNGQAIEDIDYEIVRKDGTAD